MEKADIVREIGGILVDAVQSGEAAGISVLALHEGREVFFAAAGEADREKGIALRRDHIFRLFSQTKPITSAAVMTLVEKGKLDVMDPVKRFFPSFANQKVVCAGGFVPPRRDMTVMDLLGMQSGLPYPDGDVAGQAMARLFEENTARMDAGHGMSTAEFVSRMGQCPLAFHPGEDFRYGTSADVLGGIVEVVSGVSFGEYLHKTFFEPLEMKDTAFYVPEEKQDRLVTCYQRTEEGLKPYTTHHLCISDTTLPPAFASGGAGLVSTLDDYAAFAGMLLAGGTYRGKRILHPKTVQWMQKSQVADTRWDSLTGYGYGKLMRICTDPGKTQGLSEKGEYGWDGWLGTYFANFPASGHTLLLFQNSKDTGTGRAARCVRNRLLSAWEEEL